MTHGNTPVANSERQRSSPLDDATDEQLNQLIEACANGRKNAFERLYKASSSQLFGVLQRILKTDALAEDALQDIYIKIWRNADRYDPKKSVPRTWLVSIARNHAIDVLRKSSSREDVELVLDSAVVYSLPEQKHQLNKQHETSPSLNLCLQQLSEPARECVVRAYCEGLSQEELSNQLQRPIDSVNNWIRRSLIALKECLDDHAR